MQEEFKKIEGTELIYSTEIRMQEKPFNLIPNGIKLDPNFSIHISEVPNLIQLIQKIKYELTPFRIECCIVNPSLIKILERYYLEMDRPLWNDFRTVVNIDTVIESNLCPGIIFY